MAYEVPPPSPVEAMHEAPPGGLALVEAWIDHLRRGETDPVGWLLTRPFTFEDPATGAPVDDAAGFVRYASTLAEAFPGWSFTPSRTEVQAHRVEIRARIEGQHTGPLDLGFLGGPCYPSTGRGFRLPEQTFAWEILHGRIHRFGIVNGPGIGPEAIVAKLGLTADHATDPSTGDAEADTGQAKPGPDANGLEDPNESLSRTVDRALTQNRRRRRRQRLWRR